MVLRTIVRVFFGLVILVCCVALPIGVAALAWAEGIDVTPSDVAEQPAGRPTEAPEADEFAPVLQLARGESFVPIDVRAYAAASHLWVAREVDKKKHSRTRNGRRTQPKTKRQPLRPTRSFDSLPTRDARCGHAFDDCHFYVTFGRGNRPQAPVKYARLQRRLRAARVPRTVYWHRSLAPRGGWILQYWFFYVFNDGWNVHEGDWEQITLLFARRRADTPLRPVKIGYSSHKNGQAKPWPLLVPGSGRFGDHPVVWVALGSHADYFRAGTYPISDCRKVPFHLCSDHTNRGRRLWPRDYVLARLEGPVFRDGDFGSGNFVWPGSRRIGIGINVADPRVRDVWKEPFAWLGGTKPADG